MEPDDEVQKTGDWDRLSPPTLLDISQIGHINGGVEYDWPPKFGKNQQQR
jgi:hypothetical protein